MAVDMKHGIAEPPRSAPTAPPPRHPSALDRPSDAAGAEPGLARSYDPHALHATSRFRLSKRELTNLTSQLAIMLQSGVDVSSALQTLARQSQNPNQTQILQAIHAKVLGGQAFSASLKPYTHVFGPSYVATVAAGEASGRMAIILTQLASLLRSELRLRTSLRTLIAYPILLLSVSSLVTAALVLFVLPKFAEIFAQFNTPLPLITQVLLSAATELRGRWWLWGPVLALMGTGFIVFVMSATGRRLWDTFLLRAFLLRDVTRMLLIGRACRLLGLMIDSGVPLLESLGIARSSIRNSLYQQVLMALEQSVLNGRGLGEALLKTDFIPPSAAEMLLTAERTGNLGGVTQLIGEHFEEEAENRLREIVTFIEPVITIAMGSIVAIVVMSVMLPMFDMATFAKGG